MSSHENSVNELDGPPKRRIQRRHGACEPCRLSKTKCDGRTPCGACQSERRRTGPCVYSEKARRLQQVMAESRRKAESDRGHGHDSTRPCSVVAIPRPAVGLDQGLGVQTQHMDETSETCPRRSLRDSRAHDAEIDEARMSHPLSVCAAVDEFKRLRTARGYSGQVVSRCNGFEVCQPSANRPLPKELNKSSVAELSSGVLSAAASVSGLQSIEIVELRARLDAVNTLVGEGHPHQAWADLAGVVCRAQVIQDMINHDPNSPFDTSWRSLWIEILDSEAQLSLTIGRPTCLISSFGIPSQLKSHENPLENPSSLDEVRSDLYRHIQAILGLDLSSPTAVRDFLERARYIISHNPFTRIGLCTTPEDPAEVQDLQLNIHLLLMVVYCRMASLCDSLSRDLTNKSWSATPAAEIIRELKLHQPREKLTYCLQMVKSAGFIVDAFSSLHQSNPEETSRNWVRCHSAYSAAVMLGIAKLRHEVKWHVTTEKLKRVQQIFSQLAQENSESHLFSTAVKRLHDLNSVREPASETIRSKDTGQKTRKRSATNSEHVDTVDNEAHVLGGTLASTSAFTSPIAVSKRRRDTIDEDVSDISLQDDRILQEQDGGQGLRTADSSFEDINLRHLSLFVDNSATYSQSGSSFTNTSSRSSAISFTEHDLPLNPAANLVFTHPGPPFANPFPYDAIHPPIAWNNAPFQIRNQTPSLSMLRSPTLASYSQSTSPVMDETATQSNLRDSTSVKSLNTDSPRSCLAQRAVEGSATVPKQSPTIKVDDEILKVSGTTATSVASKTTGQRPAPVRTRSANAVQLSISTSQDGPSASTMSWHPISASVFPHQVQPSLTNEGLIESEFLPRANIDSIRQTTVPSQRAGQRPNFPPTGIVSSTDMLIHSAFPSDHATCLNPGPSILEPSRMHPLDCQLATLPQYQKFLVPDTGQCQPQWRQLSVDAAGATHFQF